MDDNGYVIVSDNIQQTGYFFGKIRPDVMSQLIDEGIYQAHRMFDYQGLCPEGQDLGSVASRLLTVCCIATVRSSQFILNYFIFSRSGTSWQFSNG